MIIHLEPDILECEVKWALGSTTMNKANGGDGIPAEVKDDAVKVLHSICQETWKTQQGHRTGKGQFSFQSQVKAMPKNVQTTTNIAFISHASKVMIKILQASLQQNMNRDFQMFKLNFEKAGEPEIKLSTSIGSSGKQESSIKTSTSALLTMPKPLTVWIQTNCGKFFRRWE